MQKNLLPSYETHPSKELTEAPLIDNTRSIRLTFHTCGISAPELGRACYRFKADLTNVFRESPLRVNTPKRVPFFTPLMKPRVSLGEKSEDRGGDSARGINSEFSKGRENIVK